MMSVHTAMTMTGHIGPLRHDGGWNSQSGRMVILIPLTDCLNQYDNKCAGTQQKYDGKHDLEHAKTTEAKSMSINTHFDSPFEYMLYYRPMMYIAKAIAVIIVHLHAFAQLMTLESTGVQKYPLSFSPR
jgi:hypothetical protein